MLALIFISYSITSILGQGLRYRSVNYPANTIKQLSKVKIYNNIVDVIIHLVPNICSLKLATNTNTTYHDDGFLSLLVIGSLQLNYSSIFTGTC
jgi:hypothetical protein